MSYTFLLITSANREEKIELVEQLARLGAKDDGLLWLDAGGPALLPYASLMAARSDGASPLKAVVAVYEWQSLPLMFVADGDQLGAGRGAVERLRTILAQRGDAPYLGVLQGGHLDVYLLALGGTPKRNKVTVALGEDEVDQTFPTLANYRPSVSSRQKGWIADVVLRLLSQSIDLLVASGKPPGDAISLVGRALFTRFLADRELLPLAELGVVDAGVLFDLPARVAGTSSWLDATFNGDLLPLSKGAIESLTAQQCHVLGNIMRRAEGGQLQLGWYERWDNLDFAHIPVGVLSQAYEQHLRSHAKERQKLEGGFYTPPQIAQLIVRATLRSVDRDENVDRPRLLDPAVGAGIFLTTSLRELVARQWTRTGVRPDTTEIRRILYEQLAGFDINESALRFAALGLYLAAIELDPDPLPVGKLAFKNLRGSVLFRVGDPNNDSIPDLGSLGPRVGPEHDGKYDIVLGNPPWSSSTRLPGWEKVVEMVGRITTARSTFRFPETSGKEVDRPAPPLPNEVLDLPFVWRATEWVRADGQIAFALHGRMLFQHGEGMDRTRAALLSCLDTTSIINGTELRQTRVWPNVDSPFCILFARNRSPGRDHAFRFLSPKIEHRLNDAGVMRVDALHSEMIATTDVLAKPHIFKALFRGSRADLAILDRLLADKTDSLGALWKRSGNPHGNGYQKARPSSRYRKINGVNADQPGVDASYLHDLREFTIEHSSGVSVQSLDLPPFDQLRIHDRRPRELFLGSLLLVKQTPPAESQRIHLTLVDGDAVFNETFYGYSAEGLDPALLRYLVVILGSRTALWLALVTSGKFGVEREVIEKTTLDAIPVPPWEGITDAAKARVDAIFGRLSAGDKSAWVEADAVAADLFGLTVRDREVIEDTLTFGLPYSRARHNAEAETTRPEVDAFRMTLQTELDPLAARLGLQMTTFTLDVDRRAPWRVIGLHLAKGKSDGPPTSDVEQVLRAADQLAATELTMEFGQGGLVLARLDQRRYWTRTQARLAAQEIFWSHLPALMERAS